MAKGKKKAAPLVPAGGGEGADAETGEIVALPVLTTAAPKLEIGGKTITLKKTVNRVLLRHADGQTVFVTILSKIRTGKEIKGSTMAAAELVTVEEVTSGQEMEYIVNAVCKGLLEDEYPSGSYVGKSFAIYKQGKAPGKRYSNISLAEITVK
jgi:hypothetical protein